MTIAYTGIASTFIACQKAEKNTERNLTPISGKGEVTYKVSFDAGHPSELCHGQGLCTGFIAGHQPRWVHVACQGPGKECHHEITISIPIFREVYESGPTDVHMPIVNYSGDEFLMPDRSLLIAETGKYVNIPKQVLEKDNAGSYIFKSVIISDTPKYINE